MGIQRYKALNGYGGDADLAKNEDGEIVLYTAHAAELHHLLYTLADIRAALGVGDKPMLSELAGIVRTRMGVIKILERDAEENAAEVERLTGERDAAVRERDAARKSLVACQLDNGTAELIVSRDFVAEARRIKKTAARIVQERDAAVEALKEVLAGVVPHDRVSRDAIKKIRVTLDNIEGGWG